MNKIYFYKMMVDNLCAPHVSDGMLSLALCKPAIRRGAEQGAYIFGFGAKGLGEGRLIYVAVVTKIGLLDYYTRHNERADAVYQCHGDTVTIKPDARYHSDGSYLKRDIGSAPAYVNARVLLSTDFRYYGAKGLATHIDGCPELAKRLAALSQGHRIHHSPELRKELIELKEKLWLEPQDKVVAPSNPVPVVDDDDDHNTHEC